MIPIIRINLLTDELFNGRAATPQNGNTVTLKGYLAPFPNNTTFIVSKIMIKSNMRDMFLI